MKHRIIVLQIFITGILLLAGLAHGQEYEGHINYNPALFNTPVTASPVFAKKTSATDPLPLPFFEDFTNTGVYPDMAKWTDRNVYINNTMGFKPISRGVATFDALDQRGIPYDSFSNTTFRIADSLTSQPINLSLNVVAPGDSVYFSFFYQPQGNGFYPLPQDSLMLFFKTRFGGYVKIWSAPGSTLQPFRQVMIPITDTLYFDSFFQFAFINKAALAWADAIWNVDYIRLGAGRSAGDTVVNDLGFTAEPTFLLNDYTSIPYRQYFTNPAAERATQYICSLRNNYNMPVGVSDAYTATALPLGTLLKPATLTPVTVPANTVQQVTFPQYVTLLPLSSLGYYEKVIFQNKFFITSPAPGDPTDNDTVIRDQVFDNYLAYDDGSAEKSYYLSLYPTLPGRIAIEHHLNRADTMRGMSIYFGRQVPFAFNKGFNINVYRSLAGVNGAPADELLYTKEYCMPGYADTINNFWVYRFDDALPLPPGTFFAGIFLPAESGSDSLYLGLDVNRIGSNHTYFKVLSAWEPSLISGAIMMRPLLGQDVTGTRLPDVPAVKWSWNIYPNPARDVVRIDHEGSARATYAIMDIQGRKVAEGAVSRDMSIDISSFAPGIYFARLVSGDAIYPAIKLIKE
ncbi:hypothetical protein GCM10023093_02970 [Nemorincola caseinilytica]|uniref:Secretion system C-terminal sorting domain-containing protein n=1 Tax=Nemorincola caseinilytica TaxID=2054315 RepID=A0ABP8N5K2_9BACT